MRQLLWIGPRVMALRTRPKVQVVIGAILVLIAGVPIVQQVREFSFWAAGDRRYQESVVLDNPVQFAGRTLEVQDDLPFKQVAVEYREDRQFSYASVRLDGAELLSRHRIEVRPGRDKGDLGRYHLWIDAGRFLDRSTGKDELWIARRVEPDTGSAFYEVVVISGAGEVTVDTVRSEHRATSYPLYRSLQFLLPANLSVYKYSFFSVWPNLLIPVLYPWTVVSRYKSNSCNWLQTVALSGV